MKKILPLLLSLTSLLQAAEPTSDLLLAPKAKDSISYLMVGAAAPFNEHAIDALAPNLSFGMRHFSGIHAKDYCVTARVNQHTQTLFGQYSFLFFPITTQGFAKTHSSVYLGLGLAGGMSYLSRATAHQNRQLANKLEIKRQIEEKGSAKPEEIAKIVETVEKNQTLRRIAPTIDLPVTVGYQFANTNFIQMQISTLALAKTHYYKLSGNGIYATLNYGFGF